MCEHVALENDLSFGHTFVDTREKGFITFGMYEHLFTEEMYRSYSEKKSSIPLFFINDWFVKLKICVINHRLDFYKRVPK